MFHVFIPTVFLFFLMSPEQTADLSQQQEMAALLSKNLLTSLLIGGSVLGVLIASSFSRHGKIIQRIVLATFFFLPWMVRFFCGGYAYDTRFALLSKLSDLTVFTCCCFLLGQIFARLSSSVTKICLGIAIFTLSGLAFTLLGLHRIFPRPTSITNLVFVILVGYLVLKNVRTNPLQFLGKESLLGAFVILLFVYCFSHFLFAPLPPDADITSMGEMLGYLFQGQNLNKVDTGFGEQWALRYPAGFASLALVLSHSLNIRASEAMLLFWYFSFFVLVFGLISLGSEFSLNPFLIALFSLNAAITGWFGLRGGQVHEMLAYALGVAHLTLVLRKKWLASALCLGASIVIHPIIALPFCLVFATLALRDYSREQLGTILEAGVVLLLCVGYIGFLGLGPSSTPSQPQILLFELSPQIFFSNILKYLNEDTFGYAIFLLAIAIFSVFFWKKSPRSLFIFYPWFLGCILIDGLFGHTHWAARFQKSFNLIGIWILSVGMSQRLWDVLWESLRVRFPAWNKRIFSGAHALGIAGLLLFWIRVAGPNSVILPSPIFTRHATIRMGRFVEENTPKNSLIYFTRFAAGNTWDNLSILRGDSSRNTVQGRIFDHHIKRGQIKSRDPVNACLQYDAIGLAECLKRFGVNYLLVETEDSPQDKAEMRKIPLILERQVAGVYLFRLRL